MSRSWNKNAPIFTLDSKENGGNHRPMAAAAGTVGKWGQMGFTSIRNSYGSKIKTISLLLSKCKQKQLIFQQAKTTHLQPSRRLRWTFAPRWTMTHHRLPVRRRRPAPHRNRRNSSKVGTQHNNNRWTIKNRLPNIRHNCTRVSLCTRLAFTGLRPATNKSHRNPVKVQSQLKENEEDPKRSRFSLKKWSFRKCPVSRLNWRWVMSRKWAPERGDPEKWSITMK